MDFSTYNPESLIDAGAWLTLKDPITNKPLDARIRLAGEAGKRWRAQEEADADKRLVKAKRQGGEIDLSSEMIRRRNCKLLAAVTLEWEGIEWEGKARACNESNAFQLYHLYHWVYLQAWVFANNNSNYGEQEEDQAPASPGLNPEARLAGAVENFPSGSNGDSATAQSVGE
jgi:hypothetical protein